jgi:hypothetical protein
LNKISSYLNITLNENKQLREHIVIKDKTMEDVLDTIKEKQQESVNDYER